jgi:ABC-type transporter Mla subunit MlaD
LINKVLSSIYIFSGGYLYEILILLILLLTIYWFAKYDLIKLNSITNSLLRLNKSLGDISGRSGENIKVIGDLFDSGINLALRQNWSSFVNDYDNPNREIGLPEISDYFSLERTITIAAERKRAELIPGAITTLGLLAAFVGLLAELSVPNVDFISSFPSALLSALVVIIISMFLSLLFILFDRKNYNAAVSQLSSFLQNVSARMPISGQDSEIQQLAREIKNQNKKIGNIGLDISTNLGKYIEEDLAPSISRSYVSAIDLYLTPVLNDINKSIEKLSNQAIDIQENGMQKLVDSYIEKMNSSVSGQFESLGTTIGKVLESQLSAQQEAAQKGIKDYMESMDKQLRQLMEELNVQLDMAFTRFNETTNLSFERLDATMNASLDTINANMKIVLDSLDDQARDISLYAKNLSEEVRQLNEQLAESVKHFADQMNVGVAQTLGSFDSGLADVSRRLGNVVVDIRDAVDELPKVIKSLSRDNEIEELDEDKE